VKNYIWALVLVLFAIPVVAAEPPQQEKVSAPPPPWAYGFESAADSSKGAPGIVPFAAPPEDDGSMKHVPGSTLSFTVTQIRDSYGPADWYPGDHPQMPEIVARGHKPEVRACSLCHYPNGKGRPENAGVAGLPYEYILQTMSDFRNGARKSADARKPNTYFMMGFAQSMTDDEIKAAARYFSSMKWTPWIKVVETNTVPKTHISGGMFLRLEGDATEPIGQRIIETPVNTEATEQLRDSRSPFIAYVPVGSLKKGEALVMNGAGKTTRCTICHGEDLQGLGPVPGIAGRSPSYLVRQLYDMQNDSRSGVWTKLMKPVVAKLTSDDMIAIAAYVTSKTGTPPSMTTAANSPATSGKELSKVR
jgi:cytochrome c553